MTPGFGGAWADLAWLGLGLGAVSGGALAYEMLVRGPENVEVTRWRLAVPGLPGQLRGRRVVFVSDLHMRAKPGYRERWVGEVVPRLAPDLIFLGGDLVEELGGTWPLLEMLAGWHAPLGSYYVFGNNENRHQETAGFARQLECRGVRVLRNSHLVSEVEGERWVVAGVDDASRDADDLAAALRGVPPGTFVFLLSHTPEVFPEARARGVPLTFAGHTHGGQVRFPLVGALWTDTPRTGLKYQHGFYPEGGVGLVLSKGVGTSKLPIRLLARPEVVVVDLIDGGAGGGVRAAPLEEAVQEDQRGVVGVAV